MRLFRTRQLGLAVLGLVLLASVALVGSSAAQNAATSGSARTGATSGGTLVIGRTADIDTLDPHKATAFQTVQTLGLIYGTLVQLNSSLDLVPGLATKWKFSDNSQTLTFTLRPKVRFHDGTPFTSADVAALLKRILDPATAAVARSNLADIQSVSTPGPRTAVLHLGTPNVPILAALADLNTAILSSKDI